MRIRVRPMAANYRRLRLPAGSVIDRPNRLLIDEFKHLLQPRGGELFETLADIELPPGAEFSSDIRFPRGRVERVKA